MSDWATYHIKALKRGEVIVFRPRGNSMKPTIKSGQLVTVEPLNQDEELFVNDIVLCKVRGRPYLHFIKAINERGPSYLIGGRKSTNGWISRKSIYGICTRIEN